MDATELPYLSAGQLSHLIQNKEVSPIGVIEAHLTRIDALQPNQAIAAARQSLPPGRQSGKYRRADTVASSIASPWG